MGRKDGLEQVIKEDIGSTVKGSVKCVCNCGVSHKVFNRRGWGICNRCGRKVERPKDKFKNKMKALLKGEK